MVKTDLGELILNVASNHLVKAQQKHIHLSWELEEDIWVMTEAGMIETVIRNLLTNGIKFTPENGKIEIKLQKRDEQALICVQDTGAGMSASKQKTLFDLNANQTTPGTQNEKGTGLGLPLTREFVEQHGGQIWVESELEKGSQFYFTLPILEKV